MRVILGLLLLFVLLFSVAAKSEAGGYWSYSSYYRPGYQLYYGGYYGNSYWNYGYYRYVYDYPQPIFIDRYYPVAVTTYQPAYAPPAIQLTPTAPAAPVKPVATDPHSGECSDKIKGLEAKIARLEKLLTTPPEPKEDKAPIRKVEAPPSEPLDGRLVLVKSCGRCHGADVNTKRYGGSFTLVRDGKIDPKVTAADLAEAYKRVLTTGPDKMPPDRPLSEAEGQALLYYMGRAKLGAE